MHAWQTKLAVSVNLLSISAASVCGFGCVEIFIYINKSPTQSALRRLLWADKERISPQEWHCRNKPHCVRVASTEGLNSFGWRLQRESCIWSANRWFYRVNHTLQAFLAMKAFNYHYLVLNMLFQPDRTNKQLWFIWDLDAEFDFSLLVSFLHSFSIRLRAFLSVALSEDSKHFPKSEDSH